MYSHYSILISFNGCAVDAMKLGVDQNISLEKIRYYDQRCNGPERICVCH